LLDHHRRRRTCRPGCDTADRVQFRNVRRRDADRSRRAPGRRHAGPGDGLRAGAGTAAALLPARLPGRPYRSRGVRGPQRAHGHGRPAARARPARLLGRGAAQPTAGDRRGAAGRGAVAGRPRGGRPAEDGRSPVSSPSEKYARWAEEKQLQNTELGASTSRYAFVLDDFQMHGCRALEEGRSVLVAAPTGAGKTVVGEFAVHLALARGRKAFYTAPIKALSNQKFGELVEWLGHERVGLLTGDTSIRPDADVVVMTTEVLRNMLYADSDLLHALGFVVMDEVHYLADRMRGPVWEEVII